MRLNTLTRQLQLLATLLLLTACGGVPNLPATPHTLSECGWTPNCVNSQSGRGTHAIEPIKANAEQWRQFKAWIAGQKNWAITRDRENFLQAVVTTPTLSFRDDVQLLFLPETSVIHMHSASRLGSSDLGANARRIETLRSQISG